MENKQNGKTDQHADGKSKQDSEKKQMSTKHPEPNKGASKGNGSKTAGSKMNQDRQQSKENKK